MSEGCFRLISSPPDHSPHSSRRRDSATPLLLTRPSAAACNGSFEPFLWRSSQNCWEPTGDAFDGSSVEKLLNSRAVRSNYHMVAVNAEKVGVGGLPYKVKKKKGGQVGGELVH